MAEVEAMGAVMGVAKVEAMAGVEECLGALVVMAGAPEELVEVRSEALEEVCWAACASYGSA